MNINPENIAGIRKVLIITLSNIGDVVLTFPVINIVKENLPQADVSLMVGPKAAGFFLDNPHFKQVYPFEKRKSAKEWWRFILRLRQEHFDCVIDLRQTFLPVLLNGRYHTSLFKTRHQQGHMRNKHLNRLAAVLPDYRPASRDYCLAFSPGAGEARLLEAQGGQGQPYLIVSPGAADQAKRWPEENYIQLCRWIQSAYPVKIVIVGDSLEQPIAERITAGLSEPVYNFCGQTSLPQLATLIQESCFFVGNDSAVMHLASYYNIPSVAIFGPTDPELYGPWSQAFYAVRHHQDCALCQKKAGGQRHTCMQAVSAQEVKEKCQALIDKLNLI